MLVQDIVQTNEIPEPNLDNSKPAETTKNNDNAGKIQELTLKKLAKSALCQKYVYEIDEENDGTDNCSTKIDITAKNDELSNEVARNEFEAEASIQDVGIAMPQELDSAKENVPEKMSNGVCTVKLVGCNCQSFLKGEKKTVQEWKTGEKANKVPSGLCCVLNFAISYILERVAKTIFRSIIIGKIFKAFFFSVIVRITDFIFEEHAPNVDLFYIGCEILAALVAGVIALILPTSKLLWKKCKHEKLQIKHWDTFKIDVIKIMGAALGSVLGYLLLLLFVWIFWNIGKLTGADWTDGFLSDWLHIKKWWIVGLTFLVTTPLSFYLSYLTEYAGLKHIKRKYEKQQKKEKQNQGSH